MPHVGSNFLGGGVKYRGEAALGQVAIVIQSRAIQTAQLADVAAVVAGLILPRGQRTFGICNDDYNGSQLPFHRPCLRKALLLAKG